MRSRVRALTRRGSQTQPLSRPPAHPSPSPSPSSHIATALSFSSFPSSAFISNISFTKCYGIYSSSRRSYATHKEKGKLEENSITNLSAKPSSYWKDPNNARSFLTAYAAREGGASPLLSPFVFTLPSRSSFSFFSVLKSKEEWYGVTPEMIGAAGGRLLLSAHSGSVSALLTAADPSYPWLPWKFQEPLPKGFWSDSSNQSKYMRWLGDLHGRRESTAEDWYSLTASDFMDNRGKGLLTLYEGSPYKVLKAVFPHLEWLPWKFSKVPAGFWDDVGNQRLYMAWLSKKLGREEGNPEQWYNSSISEFLENDGKGLLNHFKGSHWALLQSLYPNAKWLPWKFTTTPQNFWRDPANQRAYLEWLGKELGYSKREDWYKVRWRDFLDNYGSTLVIKIHGSPAKLLAAVFTDFEFEPWRFVNRPYDLGKNQASLKDMIAFVENALGFTTRQQWHRVKMTTLKELGVGYAIQREGGITKVLASVYPEEDWPL